MKRILLCMALAVAFLAGGHVDAKKKKKRKPPKDLPTLMTERGEALILEPFDGDAIPGHWRVAIGKWEVEDGALKGTEQAADDHPAVIRIDSDCTDVIIQYSVMFKGGKSTGLSLNNKKGHVCSARLSPTGIYLNKDRPTKTSDEESEKVDSVKFEFKEGEWYDICVEILGEEMVASIGGDKKMMYVAFGSNKGVAKEKTNFGFWVSGVDLPITFDDVRVWEVAGPNKKWKKTKKKLEKIRFFMEKKGLR
ncbi:MAG: hypothetical protein GXP25_09615 [Planctomycetes bacterium]|nr:hypothetical protein [Planctomycetota bacterium]